MRLQEEPRVLRALGQAEQLPPQIQSFPDLPARDVEEEVSPAIRLEPLRPATKLDPITF